MKSCVESLLCHSARSVSTNTTNVQRGVKMGTVTYKIGDEVEMTSWYNWFWIGFWTTYGTVTEVTSNGSLMVKYYSAGTPFIRFIAGKDVPHYVRPLK